MSITETRFRGLKERADALIQAMIDRAAGETPTMADASRLKDTRRQGLRAPPSSDEARADLVPTSEPRQAPSQAVTVDPLATKAIPASVPQSPPTRIDGRTLRRSGRTIQFATRVSPEFDERVRQIAMRDGLLLVEVLERTLEAYEFTQLPALRARGSKL